MQISNFAADMATTPGYCQPNIMLTYEVYTEEAAKLLFPVNMLRNYARLQVRMGAADRGSNQRTRHGLSVAIPITVTHVKCACGCVCGTLNPHNLGVCRKAHSCQLVARGAGRGPKGGSFREWSGRVF
jgi:hypothetical protein